MLVSDKDSNIDGACARCGVGECYDWPVSDGAGCDHIIHRIRAILTRPERFPSDERGYGCVSAKFCIVDGEIHCCICRC